MEDKNRNKKIAIYIAILIALIGGSFIIFEIAKAGVNNAIISEIEMTSIVTGTNLDSPGEDNLVITCDDIDNCTNTYTASKDSSSDNILVKSFDKIKYTFSFKIKDSSDENNDIDSVDLNIRVHLDENDKKYVSLDDNACNGDGLCIIRDASSYGLNTYTLILDVNNAPNGYEIHPTFTFDVADNNNDNEIVLGYNASSNDYYYSYINGTYSNTGIENKMPTIVSSISTNDTYMLVGDNNFTQSAKYNGTDGRFITYLLGIKLDRFVSGVYYPNEEINFRVSFEQDNSSQPISNENWIRFYGRDIVDGIRPFNYSFPYSTNVSSENSVKKPGSLTVTKDENSYIVKLTNFNLLLKRPTSNADNTEIDGLYIATIAFTNFSPRLEEDGQNVINNSMILSTESGEYITSKTIQNTYEQLAAIEQNDELTNADILTTSAWYDENEKTKLSDEGIETVSKGTTVKYVTKFKKNNETSNTGLKEVIKFDTDAYRVLPYNDSVDIDIRIKCGNSDCSNISSDDFEVKYITGAFDNSNYELNDISGLKLSNNDKLLVNACSNINISSLTKDQVQNLYGGPCIKAKESIETIHDNIIDATKVENDKTIEIPISKVVVQTKDNVVLPNEAEVIIAVRVRVRNVSDLSHGYQATTMISTSDYDENLYFYAPQIKNINESYANALSPDSYIKTVYSGSNYNYSYGYIGDTLRIVNFTLRQNVNVENKNDDGSSKTRFKTINNETITYKIETNLVDNSINLEAEDTWYIKNIYVLVSLPKELIYIPDSDLITPISVEQSENGTLLKYLLITPQDKIKSNMDIKDLFFKAKLDPTLSGQTSKIVVSSYPIAENINGETDTSVGTKAEYTIYGTGINEVIGTELIGASGSLIEKDGTIDYILNAYNNIGTDVNDYTLIDILPYTGDTNGSDFTGSYSIKVSSDSVDLSNLKCTKELPSRISSDNENIWIDCGNISSEYKGDITGIKIENVSIPEASYLGEIVISLKTKDNKASDKYANSFIGFTSESDENKSNIIEASVINRTISGKVFLDNTGNSIKDGQETYVKDIPVTLYKINSDGILTKILDTVSDENGYYEFDNLDIGKYKIRSKYDVNKYDLTLRYATEDTSKDSDAYLINSNGTIEISDKTVASEGLVLDSNVINLSNMDIGLQLKHTFGFMMDKYITKIELNNNGNLMTNTYDNLSTVSLNVINPKNYTAKVYYGISITNNSNRAGYINLVKEDIPNGLIFDKNYPENVGWFEVDGMIGNRTLENTLVYPNDTVYLQIVLFLPARDEAGTFINTASVAEITEYVSTNKEITEKEYVNEDEYNIGDSLRYAGVNFHVIGVTPDGNEQILTLLADSNQIEMSHLIDQNDVYKWSTSVINDYINNGWLNSHNIESNSLISFNICDDASGLLSGNGGVVDASSCNSGIYTTSKVRLLTQNEFNCLINNLTDSSFLLNGDFWLMNSVYISQADGMYNEYGLINTEYDASNLVKYVKSSNSSVLPVQGTNGFNKDVNGTSNLQVRPVIRISTHNIILE